MPALFPRARYDWDDDHDVSRGLAIGAIVGIVVSIIGTIFVVGLIIWLIRRRSKRNDAAVRAAIMRGPVAPPNGYAAKGVPGSETPFMPPPVYGGPGQGNGRM